MSLPEGKAVAPVHGYTVSDLCRRYRVRRSKILRWINSSELKAIDTADKELGEKPRLVVLDVELLAFEQRRAAAKPKPAPRRKRSAAEKDYFPDLN
jgi:hypothetical protein